MSHATMLRGLVIAASLTLGGCFAQGSEAGDLDGDEREASASASASTTAGASSEATVDTGEQAGAQPGAPDGRLDCNACGNPVPWAPPTASLKPNAAPEPDPSR